MGGIPGRAARVLRRSLPADAQTRAAGRGRLLLRRRPRRGPRRARPRRLLHGRAHASPLGRLPRLASTNGTAPFAAGPHRMLLGIARSRRLLFVGGKGGTGKTSISSGLAMARALDGGRARRASPGPARRLGGIGRTELAAEARRVGTAETGPEVGPGFVDATEVDSRAASGARFATVEAMMRRMLPERTDAAAHD